MSWTFLDSKTVVARKEHRCFLCGEVICKGATYDWRTAVDDVVVRTKMHPECTRASSDWDEFEWECFYEGEMERPKASEAVE